MFFAKGRTEFKKEFSAKEEKHKKHAEFNRDIIATEKKRLDISQKDFEKRWESIRKK